MTDADAIRQFILKRAAKSNPAPVAFDGNTKLFGNVLDSFGVLELAAFVEEAFGIHIDEDELGSPGFNTLDGIAALIKSKKSQKRPG